jgi:restriction endonuclease Mrr
MTDEKLAEATTSKTPEELIEAAHQRPRDALAADLLQAIRNC